MEMDWINNNLVECLNLVSLNESDLLEIKFILLIFLKNLEIFQAIKLILINQNII